MIAASVEYEESKHPRPDLLCRTCRAAGAGITAFSTWTERERASARTAELARLATLAAQTAGQITKADRRWWRLHSLHHFLSDQARCTTPAQTPRIARYLSCNGRFQRGNVLRACRAVEGRIVAREGCTCSLPRPRQVRDRRYQVGLSRSGRNLFGYPITDASGSVTGVAFVAVNRTT